MGAWAWTWGCAALASAGVLLYRRSAAFRYHARFTLFTLWLLVGSSVPIPLMLRRPRDHRNALIPAWFARQCSKVLGMQWEVRGLENVKAVEDGCVIIMNHQSALDLLGFAELWPLLGRAAVIAKKELFYMWPFGLAIWLWGTIFIDRVNRQKARSTASGTVDHVKRNKVKLLMFPEGTRNSESQLLPFKKGAFHIALDAQVPVLPVAYSRYYFIDARKKHFGSGKVVISILPPIPTKGLDRNDLDQLLAESRDILQTEVTRISEEVKQHGVNNGNAKQVN